MLHACATRFDVTRNLKNFAIFLKTFFDNIYIYIYIYINANEIQGGSQRETLIQPGPETRNKDNSVD